MAFTMVDSYMVIDGVEYRYHRCCFCDCRTWQKKCRGSFCSIWWDCGECRGLIAFWGSADEPLWKQEESYWKAFMESPLPSFMRHG